MNEEMMTHAVKELELADHAEKVSDAILAILQVFDLEEYTTHERITTARVLLEVTQLRNLSPLTNDPEEWVLHAGTLLWHNKRNGHAWSQDGGKNYWLDYSHQGNRTRTLYKSMPSIPGTSTDE